VLQQPQYVVGIGGGLVAILVLHAIPIADPSNYICSPPDILSYDEVRAIDAVWDAKGLHWRVSLGVAEMKRLPLIDHAVCHPSVAS